LVVLPSVVFPSGGADGQDVEARLLRSHPESGRHPARLLIDRHRWRQVASTEAVCHLPDWHLDDTVTPVIIGGTPTNRCHISAWQHDDRRFVMPELALEPECGFDKRLFASTRARVMGRQYRPLYQVHDKGGTTCVVHLDPESAFW
jgi:hypothetical protein